MSVLIVTGTGTDVGKTVATAALAACAKGRVAVVKPAQTGVADGAPGDLAEVRRLSKVQDVHEFVRYPDPLSPHHAARLSGRPELRLADAVQRIVDLDALHDLVIVEGAGGLLVPFANDDRWTLVDLATRCNLADLAGMGPIAGVLPAGLPAMRDFGKAARAALVRSFGGRFDWPAFLAAHRP